MIFKMRIPFFWHLPVRVLHGISRVVGGARSRHFRQAPGRVVSTGPAVVQGRAVTVREFLEETSHMYQQALEGKDLSLLE